METLVRYGASADGGVHTDVVGGRGAWLCRTSDGAHDLRAADGLRRGLKGRIAMDDLEQILMQREAERTKGGSR